MPCKHCHKPKQKPSKVKTFEKGKLYYNTQYDWVVMCTLTNGIWSLINMTPQEHRGNYEVEPKNSLEELNKCYAENYKKYNDTVIL